MERELSRWRARLLSPYRTLEQPEPDLIISCGNKAQAHVFAIVAACDQPPFTVHLQTPEPEFVQRFDMAFISRHDWTEEKARTPNFRPMLGVPHQIAKAALEEARPNARRRWVPHDNRAVAVLIGGTNRAYQYNSETIERLIHTIRSLAADGWTTLVSTSRRSDPTILPRLLDFCNDRIVVWDRTGENPYRDFLAAADAFLVTKDSITMNCEAVTSGRPVYVFDLPKRPRDIVEKFEYFHSDMSENLGLTRKFEGHIAGYDYTPPDEAQRIANMIKADISNYKNMPNSRAISI